MAPPARDCSLRNILLGGGGRKTSPALASWRRPFVLRFALAPGQASEPTGLRPVLGSSGRSGSLLGRLHPPYSALDKRLAPPALRLGER